jgi:hypothetical protein
MDGGEGPMRIRFPHWYQLYKIGNESLVGLFGTTLARPIAVLYFVSTSLLVNCEALIGLLQFLA